MRQIAVRFNSLFLKFNSKHAQWERILLLGVAGTFVVLFFVTALPRVVYPYDLDFLEDSVLMQSVQVAKGAPVYGPPNADFDPHVYMPLYFWLGAALFWLAAPSLGLLRLVSLAATLVTTLLIYWITHRESGLRWLGLVCAGLYLAGYRINGFWYEVARVDSLFVALLLGGLALAIYAGPANWRLMAAGLVLALAFFTKQTGALVGLGLALFLFWSVGRRALFFVIPFAAGTVIPFAIFNSLTGGWFYYHVVSVGSIEPVEFGRLLNFLAFDVWGVMAGLSALAVVAVALGVRQQGWGWLRQQPWLWGILAAIVISGLARMRVGGNLNNRMPAYALLCLTPALALQGLSALKPVWAQWRGLGLTALLLIQFGLGAYNPLRYIPTVTMTESGDALIERVAEAEGPVLVMMHPYYTLLAGKMPSAQIATLWYVRKRGTLPLPDDFVERIKNGYYALIISDESAFETEADLQTLLDTYYQPQTVLSDRDAPPTLTGVVVRPSLVYFPK